MQHEHSAHIIRNNATSLNLAPSLKATLRYALCGRFPAGWRKWIPTEEPASPRRPGCEMYLGTVCTCYYLSSRRILNLQY